MSDRAGRRGRSAADARGPIRCVEASTLEEAERAALAGALLRRGLSLDVFWFFDVLVDLGQQGHDFDFRYVKVLAGDTLMGVALVGTSHRFDRSTMMAPGYPVLRRMIAVTDRLTFRRTRLGFCFAEMFTMNILPAFAPVIEAHAAPLRAHVARHLLASGGHDVVVILDQPEFQDTYEPLGFLALPYASTAEIDLTEFTSAADFVDRHPRLRRKLRALSRARPDLEIEHRSGRLNAAEIAQMERCLLQSAHHSRTPTPFQSLYNERMLHGAWMQRPEPVHTLLRLDGRIVAFATNLPCGTELGGILGGVDRESAGRLPIYERLIVAEVELGIAVGARRMHYGIANNATKIRLVNRLHPCFAFVGARRAFDRHSILALYPFTALFDVMRFEQRVRATLPPSKDRAAPLRSPTPSRRCNRR